MSLDNVPSWDAYLITLIACALAAYSVVWVVRAAFAIAKTWHWRLRLLAICSGALAGFFLLPLPWGLIVGIGSGSLTTAAVAAIKGRLKAVAKEQEVDF